MEGPRKRVKLSPGAAPPTTTADECCEEESTDFKLAILSSLHPDRNPDVLLDYLLAYHGSVDEAGKALTAPSKSDASRKRAAVGYQSSLASFAKPSNAGPDKSPTKLLTKKGRTLHLFVSQTSSC